MGANENSSAANFSASYNRAPIIFLPFLTFWLCADPIFQYICVPVCGYVLEVFYIFLLF
jgi:hypothetical protein